MLHADPSADISKHTLLPIFPNTPLTADISKQGLVGGEWLGPRSSALGLGEITPTP